MFRSLRSFDVAIVGGGPAGAICALLLARDGARVGLVHRAGCQGGCIELVSGRARRLIGLHCPDFSGRAAPGVEVHETISLWGTPEPVTWNAMCNPWGPGLAVERAPFDEVLRGAADSAGALILRGEIRSAERRSGLWQLLLYDRGTEHVLETHFLVLATGSTGRKLVGREAVGKPAQFALMTRVGTKAPEQDHALYLELGKNGWWYALPAPDGGFFLGFCTGRDLAKHMQKPIGDAFVKELRGSRLLGNVLGATLPATRVIGRPAGPQSYEEIAGNGWIAVGDAAFVSDPLSGTGIDFAIESAKLGAEALLAARRAPALAEYEEAVSDYTRRHKRAGAFHHSTARSFIHRSHGGQS
jgi:flavin-dependent dehydrogenase